MRNDLDDARPSLPAATWTVEDIGAAFVVTDSAGQKLAKSLLMFISRMSRADVACGRRYR
jgi:hypothetical protein